MSRPRIAITLGDPRGIGPEISVEAVREPEPIAADVLLVGPEGILPPGAPELVPVGRWTGGGDREAGELSARAVERAVTLTRDGTVDAIVTAPIYKPALAAAGHGWPGHTEMLRDLTGVRRTALCMTCERTPAGDPLRVVLVTGHIALRHVPEAYTEEELVAVARLADRDLRRLWGIERPRLLVGAPNPHASDQGLFGDEEERICRPAIERLRREGLAVDGPLPADTVFVQAMRGGGDVVLAPYHDVGMTAIKTTCFGGAVNVTLGLPFPRTSPDHGTAFDIAGRGQADPASMRAALELAVTFAGRALTAENLSDRFPGG